jgi:tripeptide aminopeptidase
MRSLVNRILELAISIQQIPSPTFQEAARAEFVRTCFANEGLANVEIDPTGNVYACLKGSPGPSTPTLPPVVVCAHLDTVFPINVDLHIEREPERILGPGIGDNSLGIAGLFGLLWGLRQRDQVLPGDLWLVANVCEEGLGDLRGIRSVVDRFGSASFPAGSGTTPIAYIVLEGMVLGQIYHRGLGVRRHRITVRTAGGHSWIDYGQPSAIHELANLSTRITALNIPREPRTTLNIGVISGGSSVNTIAAEARLELDLRSESDAMLEDLDGQVQELVHEARKPGIVIEMEMIGQRPSGEISMEHPLVKLAQDCLRASGIDPRLSIGSTDANLPLSLGIPSITIGLTSGGRGHTTQEFINIAPLEKGMEQVLRLVGKVWEILPGEK